MIGKHLICDECGSVTMDATFDEGAYVDVEGSYNYTKIIAEGMEMEQRVKNTEWMRVAFQDPEDAVAINFSDYCADCK